MKFLIRKIRQKKNLILSYDEVKDNSVFTTFKNVEYLEKPQQEFSDCLQELSGFIAEINQLNKLDENYITVQGLTLIYTATHLRGCTITGYMPINLSLSPKIETTPLIIFDETTDTEKGKILKEKLKDKILNICELASKFIDGDRQQPEQLKLGI